MSARACIRIQSFALLAMLTFVTRAIGGVEIKADCAVVATGNIEVGDSIWINCVPDKLLDLVKEQQKFRSSQLSRIEGIADKIGLSNCEAEELITVVAREKPPRGKSGDLIARLAASRRASRGVGDLVDDRSVVSEGDLKTREGIFVGVPPEELDDMMEQVRQMDAGYLSRVERLGKDLGINRCATANFLKILGEQSDIADIDLSDKLTKIANLHLETVAKLNAFTTENKEVEVLRKDAAKAVDEGDYGTAEKKLREADKVLAEVGGGADLFWGDYARVKEALGRLHLTQLDYEGAAESFEQAADFSSRRPVDKARYLELAAGAFQGMGKYDDAEENYEDAMELYRKNPDGSPPEAAIATLNNIAGLFFARTDYAEAMESFREALNRAQCSPELEMEVQASLERSSYTGLADVNQILNQFEAAEGYYIEVLSLTEILKGTDHPALIPAMTHLAWLKTGRGEYARAEFLYQRAIGIADARGIGRDLESAAIENNLAVLYYQMGRFDRAEALWLEVEPFYAKRLGEDHLITLGISQNIAKILRKKGNLDGAEARYRRVLKVWEGSEDRSDNSLVLASVYASLGDLYVSRGDDDSLDKAEDLFSDAIDLVSTRLRRALRKIQGRDKSGYHLLLAGYRQDRAVVYAEQGRNEEAVEELIEVRKIFAAKLSEEHPLYGTATSSLAQALTRLGRLEDAVPLYLTAIGIAERSNRPLIAASRSRNLATVYEKQGNLDEARHHLKSALRIYENLKDAKQVKQYRKVRGELERKLQELDKGSMH